jgi:hypothetical protein
MAKTFNLKAPKNLFETGEELPLHELFKSSTKEGFVRISEEEDYLVLSQGIPRVDGKIVTLPDEIFMNKESLVKEINYNLISERRLNESEFNFLLLDNSGVLEREHLCNQIFFHSEMKDFLTDILIDKMKNSEIEGVSYYFFENVGREELISQIESITVMTKTGEMIFRISSLLDGRCNELRVEIEKIEDRFNIKKLIEVIEELAEEDVLKITMFCNVTLMNHSGMWYINRTPLVIEYRNCYSELTNYLSTYKVFDSNKWESDIKKFVKNKDYVSVQK